MQEIRDVVIVGGGLAGLSAAIYLGRAKRDVLVVDAGHSMAVWEPDVQNYLGFPEGISGSDLLARGREQAIRFGADFAQDEILEAKGSKGGFVLVGRKQEYRARRLLVATGIFHIPPDIPGVGECLGHSMFFCKDCDGYRVQDKRIAVIGKNEDAVEYALAMLAYSPSVIITTNGGEGYWSNRHAGWLEAYQIPVHTGRIEAVVHEGAQVCALQFEGGRQIAIDMIFTTRGDYFHHALAKQLGAEVDDDAQIVTDCKARTTVPGLYAAGCVTPANCQMVIAAGQGATAAQAINRDLFEEALETHALHGLRDVQIRKRQTLPEVIE